MFGRLFLILVALLVFCSCTEAKQKSENESPDTLIDIDYYNDAAVAEGSGSGMDSDTDLETDDEDLMTSESGSGAMGMPKKGDKVTTLPTTKKPLTPCQNLREASKHLLGNFVPRCTENGEYDKMQCRGHPGTGTCWCSDMNGREIPGTAMAQGKVPDCEKGSNLPPCVFKYMQHLRSNLLGGYRPRCTLVGEFEKQQCDGSVCFCVNSLGALVHGTQVTRPKTPDCTVKTSGVVIEDMTTEKARTSPKKDKKKKPLKPGVGYTIQPPNDKTPMDKDKHTVDMVIPGIATDKAEDSTRNPNETGEQTGVSAAHVITQPGILAAIIGGAVVGLLCAILLVMFIVYRMRKKDEGSYPLDEPHKKMPVYSPISRNDKEFYA
ncbi:uncharacterized protein LOC121377000 [Gigantopelta aegis]|uniref:uncharacterized protein LOC121377000 n=1 Tax=Gigantopelta aegis TaxID=1735272 RepID=UPI001B88E07B|nr:uncharacterized protein LOC121377000 [Gigantopelta aegis]